MGFFSDLGKKLIDLDTPTTFKDGQKFEQYVRNELFIDRYYELLDRTHDYQTNKQDFVQSSMKPDFTFMDRLTKRRFYVEAKFRRDITSQGKYQWCNDQQLRRYQEYHREFPVFIILGVGEKPSAPELNFLIPLSQAKYTGLYEKYVDQFEIGIKTPVASKVLWGR